MILKCIKEFSEFKVGEEYIFGYLQGRIVYMTDFKKYKEISINQLKEYFTQVTF